MLSAVLDKAVKGNGSNGALFARSNGLGRTVICPEKNIRAFLRLNHSNNFTSFSPIECFFFTL